MQRFTLLHDSTAQGWQATYLAFHIAARLGAPLQVLIIDSASHNKVIMAQRAAHVEVGGRAAGVVMETHLLMEFSIDTLKEKITAIDGLFLPQRLIPDGEAASVFLDAFSCPLWVASKEPEINGMAVLVDDIARDDPMIKYTKTLSLRLGQPLTGFIREDTHKVLSEGETLILPWLPLDSLSIDNVVAALMQLHASLFFIGASNAFLAGSLPCNCVIYPGVQDA